MSKGETVNEEGSESAECQKSSSSTRRKSRVSRGRTESKGADAPIEAYIPTYLQRFIAPYHGDFCYATTFHPRLICQLMVEGFLPIATRGALLPKLHEQRSVVILPQNHHVSKSTRKKAKSFDFTINQAFFDVVKGCCEQHDHCWLYPPLVKALQYLTSPTEAFIEGGTNPCFVQVHSIEVWKDKQLVAGELGYQCGASFTSMTGFSTVDSSGSVQLACLGRLLSKCGFELWDLGMDMDYKQTLGAWLVPRHEFVQQFRELRCKSRTLSCPLPMNARSIIDDIAMDGPSPSESQKEKLVVERPVHPSKQSKKQKPSDT